MTGSASATSTAAPSPVSRTPDAPRRSPRRADVEGLRILAVGLVVAYHYAQAGVSGGVDVFLFISGYFVLGSLLRRIQRSEPLELRRFWARTFWRLVPAAWTVLVVTAVGIMVLAPAWQRSAALEDVVHSGLYVENLNLVADRQVYGAASTYLNPAQHFWSLSVQAQVFLLVPAVLALGGFVASRRPARRTGPGLVLALTLGATVVSATVAALLVRNDQSSAYFSTVARLWEFLAGATVALLLPRLRLGQGVRTLLGWVGLAGLALTGIVVDGTTTFPGPAALVPLTAASLVIVAGSTPTRFGVDRLLALRPVAAAGRYSYGLYLWHWPVMSLWLLTTGSPRLGARGVVAATVVSCALAVATHHLVERPLRQGWRERARRPRLATVGTAVAAALSVALVGTLTVVEGRRLEEAQEIAAAATLTTHPGAMALYDPARYPVPDAQLPIPVLSAEEPARASDSAPAEPTAGGCDVVGHEPDMWCMYGSVADFGNQARVAVVGASHVAVLVAPLHAVAQATEMEVTSYIRGGCPFVFEDVRNIADYYPSSWAPGCSRWNEKLLADLLADPPDLVVMSLSRPFGPDGRPEWIPDAYVEAWEVLTTAGIPVLAIRASAQMPLRDRICPDGNPDEQCTFQRSEIYGDDQEILGRPLPDGVTVLDLSQYACMDGVCPSVVGNVRVYKDQSHITHEFAMTTWPIIYDFIYGTYGWGVR